MKMNWEVRVEVQYADGRHDSLTGTWSEQTVAQAEAIAESLIAARRAEEGFRGIQLSASASGTNSSGSASTASIVKTVSV